MRAQSISSPLPRPSATASWTVRKIVLSRLRNYYRRRLNDWFLGRFSFLTLRDRRKKMVSVPVRREQVAYAQRRGLSQRRSCTLLKVARSALGYRSVRAAKDGPVLARMAALGAQYPRFGYRRIRIFLGREGHAMSWGRAYRLWRRAKLQVPRRRPRKRIASGRPRPQAPTGANQVWSYDFVFDWCANGQQLKCLTVTDEWTKEGLAIEVDGRIRSGRVIEVLSRLISERGAPLYCVRTMGRSSSPGRY